MAKPLKTKDELKAATLEELEKEQAYFEKRKAAEKSAAQQPTEFLKSKAARSAKQKRR